MRPRNPRNAHLNKLVRIVAITNPLIRRRLRLRKNVFRGQVSPPPLQALTHDRRLATADHLCREEKAAVTSN